MLVEYPGGNFISTTPGNESLSMKTFLKRLFFKIIGKSPIDLEMVSYWKTKESVEAKVTIASDNSIIMKMMGEKYDLPGFPRGYLLFGKLSKIKHEIKNQIFNDSWAKLEKGIPEQEVVGDIRNTFDLFPYLEEVKYDMIPPERMMCSVREIHRVFTKIAPSPRWLKLRDILCLILAEDDSYRFRVQWVVTYFHPRWWSKSIGNNLLKKFEHALVMLEHAEVLTDMKERIRLLRRILLMVAKDNKVFEAFCREVDWNKLKLTKADKYFFRGKYFKVDMDVLTY